MAKIHTESVVITFNKLVKDSDDVAPIATADMVAALASVAEELAGAGIVVEVESA
jgi:transketolase C-terminal domain/subunit